MLHQRAAIDTLTDVHAEIYDGRDARVCVCVCDRDCPRAINSYRRYHWRGPRGTARQLLEPFGMNTETDRQTDGERERKHHDGIALHPNTLTGIASADN